MPVSQFYMCVYTLAATSLDSRYDFNVFSFILITVGLQSVLLGDGSALDSCDIEHFDATAERLKIQA